MAQKMKTEMTWPYKISSYQIDLRHTYTGTKWINSGMIYNGWI